MVVEEMGDSRFFLPINSGCMQWSLKNENSDELELFNIAVLVVVDELLNVIVVLVLVLPLFVMAAEVCVFNE